MTEPLESTIKLKHAPYTKAEAIREAERCLYCFDPPCVKACPTSIDIPTFIKKIATNNILSSAKTIISQNILGFSCAKACPVEVLCGGACVYNDLHEAPIEIGRLQAYAMSHAIRHSSPEKIIGKKKPATAKTVALIGGGPASLAAAALLAHASIKPTIYEKSKNAGGLNTHGIAPYKLKNHEAHLEINWLKTLGIEFELGIEVGLNDIPGYMISWTTLKQNYDGIFVGVGLGEDKILPLEGINASFVVGACDIIAKIKTDPDFRLAHITRAHIIGGGNTAMDIAHELKLLGVSEVHVLYRKRMIDMNSYRHELLGIQKAGVLVHENVELKQIVRDNDNLVGIITTSSDEVIKTDLIVYAIGQETAEKHFCAPIPFDQKGRVIVDPQTFRVQGEKIWAGGDCVNGGKEVVYAVQDAKIAVADMIQTLLQ